MKMSWSEIDIDRVKLSNYRARQEVQLKRKKNKSKKLAAHDAFVHQEGVQYQSASFHVWEKMSRGKKRVQLKARKDNFNFNLFLIFLHTKKIV